MMSGLFGSSSMFWNGAQVAVSHRMNFWGSVWLPTWRKSVKFWRSPGTCELAEAIVVRVW